MRTLVLARPLHFQIHLLLGFIFLLGLLTKVAEPAAASELNLESANLVNVFATAVCGPQVPLTYKGTYVELNGDAKANLANLLKRLADLGVSGAAKYIEKNTAGVLEDKLVAALKDGQNCRLHVWDDIKASVFAEAIANSASTSLPGYYDFTTPEVLVTCHYGDPKSDNNTCSSIEINEDYAVPPGFAIYRIDAPKIVYKTDHGESKTDLLHHECKLNSLSALTGEQIARLTQEAKGLYDAKQLYGSVRMHFQTAVKGSYHDATATMQCKGWLIPLYAHT